MYGEIYARYTQLNGTSGILGMPIGDTQPGLRPGTTRTRFENGCIYWSEATGAHEVHGEMILHYCRLGEDGGFLGLPTSDEATAPGGGRLNEFQNGTIYWSARTGPREVHGEIRATYLSLGGPGGFLAYPLTDETPVLNAQGNATGGALAF